MHQNQEIHKDADWQDKMVEIEMRVSDMNGYKDIAFFHHLMFEKRWETHYDKSIFRASRTAGT